MCLLVKLIILIISMSASYSFVLAGKYSVGKSSIFQRLKTGTAPDGIVEGMTWGSAAHDDEGLDSFVYQTQLAGKKIKVTLWDTGGQERYESMTANYYRNAHAVILVYAVDEEGTLFALNELVGEAKSTSRQGDNLVMAVWGNKCDLSSHTVKQDAVDAFLSTHHIPEELNCRVSVLNTSVESALLAVIEHVDKQFNRVGDMDTITRENEKLFQLGSSHAEHNQARRENQRCCNISS